MWPAAECSALAHREPSGTHPRDRLPILWVSLAQSPSLKVDPTLASTPTKSLTVTKAKWSRSGAPASSPMAGENSGQRQPALACLLVSVGGPSVNRIQPDRFET